MSDRPNILYILSDQHAQGISGCYGDTVVRTPNIDRLSHEGVRFTNAYTPSPICLPARMSLLTGRYPFRQNCWSNSDVLASDIPTFAHAMGAAGYNPVLMGRMHALGPDQLHGYALREIGDHMTDWVGGEDYSMGVLSNAQRPFREAMQLSGAGQMSFELMDRDVTTAALGYLDEIAARRAKGDSDPFSLSLGYMLPHQPYVADPDLVADYIDKISPPRLPRDEMIEPRYLAWWREKTGMNEMTEAEELRAKAAYYALVETMDSEIGKVLDRLKALGLAENTLIVYASDHGDQLGERDLWFKQTFYDQSTKVPLVLSWPAQLPQNETRDHIVSLVDLSATLVEAAGHAPLPQSDGVSLLGIATNPETDWRDEVFSEYCTDGLQAWSSGKKILTRMIRTRQWKLNYFHNDQNQMFDMSNDPDETRNLIDDPTHATIAQALLQKLLAEWHPQNIEETIERSIANKKILQEWARSTSPKDHYRWQTTAEQNWLSSGCFHKG